MSKRGKIVITVIAALTLTGCEGSSTSETATPSTSNAVPSTSETATPTPNELFAQDSGLTGAELTLGMEWSQSMCSEIAQVVLEKGNDPKFINTGMLRWFDAEGLDLFNFDKASIVPLTIAGAKAYCPEYEDGVTDFFAE